MSADTDNPDGPSGSVSIGKQAAETSATAEAAAFRPPTDPTDPAEPTPTVGHDQQTKSHPAGSAMPDSGIPATERPEVLVGAAFAGGLVAAKILKRLGR